MESQLTKNYLYLIMSNLRILNGELVTPDKVEVCNLFIEESLIRLYSHLSRWKTIFSIPLMPKIVTSLLVLFDLQVNGSQECDLWANPDALQFASLCASMLKAGVTAFLPTLITADIAHLHKNMSVFWNPWALVKQFHHPLNQSVKELLGLKSNAKESSFKDLIFLPGIHLEGPYLSNQRIGAHPPNILGL